MKQAPEDIFIVGCPRSGTYLFSTILNHHFSVGIPLETHFIPLFYRFLPLWGDLSKEKNRLRLMEDIVGFLEIWTHYELTGVNTNNDQGFSLLEVADQTSEIARNASGYSQMVSGLLKAYSHKMGKLRWGEKSAFYNHQPLEYIDDSVSNLKVVHLIRDPRDVALSWRKIWCGPKWVTECALYWRAHIREKRRWGEAHPQQYLEIRYEDLVESPESVLSRLEDFIGAERENRDVPYWESPLAKTLSDSSTHALLGKPLQRGNSCKWKTQMPQGDLDIIENLCWNETIALGYETGNSARPESGALQARILRERLFGAFTSRRIQVLVKDLLPVFIRFARGVGVSLPNVFFKFCSRNCDSAD